MHFRHHFERLAMQMSPEEDQLLIVFYLDAPVSLGSLREREDAPTIANLPRCLRTLLKLNLVETWQGTWSPSWSGYGVVNWLLQKEAAGGADDISLPGPHENGHDPALICGRYRETLFQPGYCWCCHSRFAHFDQILAAAQALLGKPSGR